MREANHNTQAFNSTDLVRWYNYNEGPDDYACLLSRYMTGGIEVWSRPIANHAMQVSVFQFVYLVVDGVIPTEYGVTAGFQCSQDGIHWDDIPSSSFTIDLGTIVLDASINPSFTVELLCDANYIRVGLFEATEAVEPNPTDTVKVYLTAKET